jgi:type VI secretion system protein ImpA
MEQLWDQVHPRDPDEGTPDFIGRKSMCDSLTKVRQFLNPLRQTTLFRTERNQFTGEDLLRFASEGASAAGYIPFRQALDTKDADQAEEYRQTFVETVERLDAIRDAIKRADDMLVANADGMTGTNFKDTYDLLDTLRRAVLPYSGAAESEAAADVVGGGSPGTTSGGPALSGGVNSRDDVIRAIDAIVDYYKSREPGSPVPVLMKRAKHWVTMDFLEVLDDLVPESMAAAKQVLVSKLDEPVASETDY